MDRMLRLGAPALALALLVGCGAQENAPSTPATDSGTPPAAAPAPSTEAAPAPSAPAAAPAPAEAAPGLEGPKSSAVTLKPDEIANIKKLPAVEYEAALKQAVCPVSDAHLGAMDVPVKVTAEGRTIYLCCESCEEAVAKDPKKYIAILDKK